MLSPTSALDDLRRQIDEIDDAMHDLLMRRTGLVEQIARVKGADRVYMRPDREAAILRRLASRHRGRFPFPVVVRMWREMLAAFTRLQGPFAVAVWAPDERRDLWDAARDHFGSLTPMLPVKGPLAAVSAVTESMASVAVVPWPDDNDGEHWWPALMSDDPTTPQVIARLPFVQADAPDARPALAVARIAPEPTGDDRTLIGIELTDSVSRGRIMDVTEAVGLTPLALSGARIGGPDGRLLYVVEVAGFIGPGHEVLALLLQGLGAAGLRVAPIGSYAAPVAPGLPGRRN